MTNQPRVAKVLAALLVSMTVGAIVLMALGNNPPSAGPFCLSSYYRLTKAGNIEQLAAISGLASPDDINCHFCLCNGLGGSDGQIQPTEKWQKQWSVVPSRSWYGSGQTIRICIIANGQTAPPTECQIKRIEAMVEALARKFNIQPESIYYPSDWQ
jgi:hypothetical protein